MKYNDAKKMCNAKFIRTTRSASAKYMRYEYAHIQSHKIFGDEVTEIIIRDYPSIENRDLLVSMLNMIFSNHPEIKISYEKNITRDYHDPNLQY